MTALPIPIVAGAIQAVAPMGLQQRLDLAGRVLTEQPTLLYLMLMMQRFGATIEQSKVLIELLLEAFTAMKASGGKGPVVSEELQRALPGAGRGPCRLHQKLGRARG